jgi:hypothetical protein
LGEQEIGVEGGYVERADQPGNRHFIDPVPQVGQGRAIVHRDPDV